MKLSPLSAIDPLTSTFTAGISFRPVPRLGLHFDYGWQYEKLKLIDRTSELDNRQYYEVRPEVRYFVTYGEKEEVYLALEGFYIPYTFSRDNSYITLENGQDIRFDRADGNRLTHGLVLKAGVQFLIDEVLILEVFGGFGYRRREINIFNLVNPRNEPIDGFEEFFSDPYKHPGVRNRLHLSLGARIGGIVAGRKAGE